MICTATQVGFSVTPSLHSIRVMSLDQLGIIVQLTQMLAKGYQLPRRLGRCTAHAVHCLSRGRLVGRCRKGDCHSAKRLKRLCRTAKLRGHLNGKQRAGHGGESRYRDKVERAEATSEAWWCRLLSLRAIQQARVSCARNDGLDAP